MRIWLTLLATVFVGSTLTLSAMEARTNIDFEAGYRQDQLSWNFKAPNASPLIEARSTFKNIHIFQVGVNAKASLDYNIMARAKASYGWIIDGDTRQALKVMGPQPGQMNAVSILKSDNVLDGRYVADLSIAIGYPICFYDACVTLSPVVGYAYSTQRLKEDAHSRDFFARAPDATGVILVHSDDSVGNNLFSNKWYGPFIGLDIDYNVNPLLTLYAQIEYHYAHFKGRRDSNIGFSPIDQYNHTVRNSHGMVVNLGANYLLADGWYAGIDASFQDWSAHKNVDIGTALVNAGFEDVNAAAAKMKSQPKWKSVGIALSIGRSY